MRILFLFLFLTSSLGWSQEVFKSPYTQSWPDIFNSRIDEVDRSISVGHSEIVIITQKDNIKEVETFVVQKIIEKNNVVVFECLTKEREPARVIIPLKKEIDIIDVFKPSEKTGEEEHLRFYVYF